MMKTVDKFQVNFTGKKMLATFLLWMLAACTPHAHHNQHNTQATPKKKLLHLKECFTTSRCFDWAGKTTWYNVQMSERLVFTTFSR